MKKIYNLIAALLIFLMCSTSVSAGTIVGNEDNTTPWWSAFSDGYAIESGKSYHFVFTNYTNESQFGYNWILIAATNATRDGAQGYSEYFVLRNDNWAWGPADPLQPNVNQDSGTAASLFAQHTTISSDYNWSIFSSEMNGSNVDMTVSYVKGQNILVKATITATSGNVYNYSFAYSDVARLTENTVTVFLSTECGHIDIIKAEETIPDNTFIETVGKADCTSGFATRELATQVIDGEGGLHYTFINHNNGSTTNFHNFILEANDGNGHFIDMRADNYSLDNAATALFTNGVIYNNTYNWNNFCQELDGATVDMYIYKKGTKFIIESTITTTSNQVRKYQVIYPNVDAAKMYVYLMVEKAYLEIVTREKVDLPTYIDLSKDFVGYLDCSSPYLGYSSPERVLPNDKGYKIKFKNINNGSTTNAYNWILRCFNNDNPWTMNFNLRADHAALFPNGASWDEQPGVDFVMNSNFTWDNFTSEMDGADVDMKVYRMDNVVFVEADITTSTGNNWKYNYIQSNITSNNCAVALSQEAALLEISSWEEFTPEATAINNISASKAITARKTVCNGKLLIETANGTYNAVGAIVK